VKTWVTKTRQDQINNDTNPEKTRADYEDGKPQRDRVLPLPSGHPEGRTEDRAAPKGFNTVPDSSGQGGQNRPPKDPSALKDQPEGKALHERPRSSAVPGENYGHPYIDQSTSTGLKRRIVGNTEFWDVEDGEVVAGQSKRKTNYRIKRRLRMRPSTKSLRKRRTNVQQRNRQRKLYRKRIKTDSNFRKNRKDYRKQYYKKHKKSSEGEVLPFETQGLKKSKMIKQMPAQIDEIWDVDDNGELIKVAVRSLMPQKNRQKKMKGQVRIEYDKKRRRMSKGEKHKESLRAKRRYNRNPNRAIKYQQNRRKRPKPYSRKEFGGPRTKIQQKKQKEKDK